jgi:hypothetical protein
MTGEEKELHLDLHLEALPSFPERMNTVQFAVNLAVPDPSVVRSCVSPLIHSGSLSLSRSFLFLFWTAREHLLILMPNRPASSFMYVSLRIKGDQVWSPFFVRNL